ncbi:hypothetical protein FOL47_006402, partial [Perkinsus chesapeaki]
MVLSLFLSSILIAVSASSHLFIRVYPERYPISAPDEHLFLCPEEVLSEIDLSGWPRNEVTLNGTLCSSSEEVLDFADNRVFFECLAEVVNITTHALDSIGVDATISDGTLLGWYRHHKGFVPWDVDGDISIMKSDCRKSFEKHSSPDHKNIASLVQELMPKDQLYEVYGIKIGVGSGLEEDEWEDCENPEFRVFHRLNGTACHVDIFQEMQSTDPEEPCTKCPGYLDGKVTVCRYPDTTNCGFRDDILPITWDRLSWADCKVPSRPARTLEHQIGGDPEFRNLQRVPGNYKYGKQILVVGRPVDDLGKEIIIAQKNTSSSPPPASASLGAGTVYTPYHDFLNTNHK